MKTFLNSKITLFLFLIIFIVNPNINGYGSERVNQTTTLNIENLPVNPITKTQKEKNITKRKKASKFKPNDKDLKREIRMWYTYAIVFGVLAIVWIFLPIKYSLIGAIGYALGALLFLIVALVKTNNLKLQEANGQNQNTEQKINTTNNNNNAQPNSTTLTEVLYLKNGSVIKCTVIEQVMGQSVKIRTSDGSIYVYKMEEIEKITKP